LPTERTKEFPSREEGCRFRGRVVRDNSEKDIRPSAWVVLYEFELDVTICEVVRIRSQPKCVIERDVHQIRHETPFKGALLVDIAD
jgi:hypothetical protein